jgi:hypothetical protein
LGDPWRLPSRAEALAIADEPKQRQNWGRDGLTN